MIISGKLPETHDKKTSFFVTSFVQEAMAQREAERSRRGGRERRSQARRYEKLHFQSQLSYRVVRRPRTSSTTKRRDCKILRDVVGALSSPFHSTP